MALKKILTPLLLLISSLTIAQNTVKILYIGNSLTYYNEMPELVKKEAGKVDIEVDYIVIAKPNYALIDHLNEGDIQPLIRDGKFDYVIVQQGPSSQPEGRQMLIDDGKTISELCKKSESQLCFFMVWPSLNYYSTFDGVIESYTLAAKNTEAILIPVGAVWKDHFETSNQYDYYGLDGFHPSGKGSKVAAEVIVKTLFTRD